MRIYLSGWQATNAEREIEVIKAKAIRHRCLSFCSVQKIPGLPYYLPRIPPVYELCKEHKIGILMDSGVIGYRSHKKYLIRLGKPITKLPTEDEFVELYVAYVKANEKDWDGYFTIDLETEDSKIYERYKRLRAMGIKPMPVYQGDGHTDFLKRYSDEGADWIGIPYHRSENLITYPDGRSLRQYLDAVFDAAAKLNLKLHGLGLSAAWLMLEYPWFSVDSSSWSRAAGYGCVLKFDEVTNRMSTFHISTRHSTGKGAELKLNKRAMDEIKQSLEADGFNFEELQNSFVARHVYNGLSMLKLADAADKRHQSGSWGLFF
jgi:hypothetical protein